MCDIKTIKAKAQKKENTLVGCFLIVYIYSHIMSTSSSFTIKELTDKYCNGYEFNTNDCTVILIKDSKPNIYILDRFVCNDDAKKGLGRELLLKALKYLKEKDKAVEHITLASVPHIKKHSMTGLSRAETKSIAQKKLNKYYGSLGFTPSRTVRAEENEFEGNLTDLIKRIEAMKGGRTKGAYRPFQTPSKVKTKGAYRPFQTPYKVKTKWAYRPRKTRRNSTRRKASRKRGFALGRS